MASIIVDLSDDIKKIQSLKKEIQQVKKELSTINVKVELDIKRDMEARLKALTDQYDALVQKVAQAEAKIAESTARINKSAETIIKAQEQMTKAASGQGAANAQGASGGNTAAANAQTASVEAQTKAYDELADEINNILGTREQNIRKLVEEQNAIKRNNDLIRQVKKDYTNSNGVISEKGLRLLEVYNNNLLRHKAALSEVQQVLGNEEKLYSAAEGSMQRLSQELGRMRIAYRRMTDEQKASPFGQELLASIEQADSKIKQLDASIGNHQRNVGNYASGWNGLSMSIQQIGRELPSLAMGWNTFFLAISNNLPILTDEIKRAKDEYNNLKKAGQQATPVWKQVVSSLLSWQTALTVGITLLTLYGNNIIDWIGGLSKAKREAEDMGNNMKNMSRIMAEGASESAKERVQLDLLYNASIDQNRSMKERIKAVDELKRKYPDYFGKLTNEAILAGNASEAYKRLTENILKAAQARSAMKIIEENYNKIFQIQKAVNADTNWINRNAERTNYGKATEKRTVVMNSSAGPITQTVEGLTEDAAEFNRRQQALRENLAKIDRLNKENKSLADQIDTTTLTDNVRNTVSMSSDGMKSPFSRSELDFSKEIEKRIREMEERAMEASLETYEMSSAEQSAMNNYLQEYGTYWQKRLAITQEYQQKIAEAGGAGTWQGRLLQKQMEESLKELDFSQFKDSISFADIFGNLDAQTTGALKSLRDKLKEYINNAAKDLHPEDLKELQDAFNDLDFKIAERDPFGELGKSLDGYKSAQDAVTKAQQDLNTVMQGGVIVTGVYTDETGKLVVETLSQAQAEERLNDAQKKRAETLTDLTTAMNSIGSKGMAIVNAGNEIAGMLDNFGVAIPEAVSSMLSGLGQVMSGLASIDITNPFSLITGAVSVISGIGNTIAGWFSGDKKNEKQIQRLQDQIDVLTSSYDKLGRAVEDSYSKDASNLIEQQNEMLEQQKVLIEQQIREEEDKKKTDDGRIEEWKQQLEEINQTIEDNKEAAVDAIFGEDLQSAIDSFSSAYADAWTNGEDRAQSARDTVKKMMQQMVTESIKAAMQSSGSMEEIRQKLQQFYADNILTGWEQDYIYNMAEELQKELDKQFGWADSLMGGDTAKKQQSASSAYGTEMTQDQAGELTGRFTALYESSLRQETIQQGISNIAEETRSIIAQSYLELQQISENTGEIIKPIKQMQLDIAEVKKNTSRL